MVGQKMLYEDDDIELCKVGDYVALYVGLHIVAEGTPAEVLRKVDKIQQQVANARVLVEALAGVEVADAVRTSGFR